MVQDYSDTNLNHLVTGARRLGHVDLEDEGDILIQNVAYQLHSVAVPHHRGSGVSI